MAEEKAKAEKSVQSEQEVTNIVGDYPERPYEKAVSKEHAAFLEEQAKK